MIDRTNYEMYIVDYFDGTLDKVTAEELLRFLERNPDLQDEFEAYRSMTLSSDDSIVFENKDQLKKTLIKSTKNITEENYEEFFIGHTEGILTDAEKSELDHFITLNPHLQKELTAFEKTRLTADLSIRYPAKADLKKKIALSPFTQRMVISFSAAAALLVIFISIYTLRIVDHRVLNSNDIAATGQAEKVRTAVVDEISDTQINAQQRKLTHNALPDNNKTALAQREPYKPIDQAVTIELEQLNESQADLAAAGTPENRTEYSEIYNYQKVIADSRIQVEKDQSGFLGFAARGMKKIRKAGGEADPDGDTGKFSLWDIAYLGVAGYNRITNSNLSLDHRTDNNGKLTNFALGRGPEPATEK